MIKAIGFNQGQFGDLCINLIACRSFKERFPESHLVFGINKKYETIKEIFLFNDLIDEIHIWENYDNWPSQNDFKYCNENKFDIIFNPMPKHTSDYWYLDFHQTQEVCYMHGLSAPDNLQINLNKYFNIPQKNNKFVAVNLFAETNSSAPKTPDIEKAKKICKLIESMGFTPIQIGTKDQPSICQQRFLGSFFDCVKFVLSCRFLFTVDSAINWIMSGYNFPVVGIYAYEYYHMANTSYNWQPKNTNSIYLEKNRIENILLEDIEQAIKKIL
jgi:ADP-heptose:LPS heptosyltransferase